MYSEAVRCCRGLLLDLRKVCSWFSTLARVRLLRASLRLTCPIRSPTWYVVFSLSTPPLVVLATAVASAAALNGLTDRPHRRRSTPPRRSIITSTRSGTFCTLPRAADRRGQSVASPTNSPRGVTAAYHIPLILLVLDFLGEIFLSRSLLWTEAMAVKVCIQQNSTASFGERCSV